MTLILIGVLIWSFVHFIPAAARNFRQGLIDKLGEGPYKGLFAAVIVLSIILMVFGWRSTPENYIYQLPSWSRPLGIVLMLISFILFGAAKSPTGIKSVIRHPMLTAMIVWAVSHLLTNGTTRALLLFGGLGLWAFVQIVLTNRRDGVYVKPESPGLARELRVIGISVGVFIVAMLLHPLFAGVSLMP